jgi:hypothetical protein
LGFQPPRLRLIVLEACCSARVAISAPDKMTR